MTEKGNRMTEKEWNDEEEIKQNEGVKGADEFLWVPTGSGTVPVSPCEFRDSYGNRGGSGNLPGPKSKSESKLGPRDRVEGEGR